MMNKLCLEYKTRTSTTTRKQLHVQGKDGAVCRWIKKGCADIKIKGVCSVSSVTAPKLELDLVYGK